MSTTGKALHEAQRIEAEQWAAAFNREAKIAESVTDDERFHDGEGGCGYRWDTHNPNPWGGDPVCPTETEAKENWGDG